MTGIGAFFKGSAEQLKAATWMTEQLKAVTWMTEQPKAENETTEQMIDMNRNAPAVKRNQKSEQPESASRGRVQANAGTAKAEGPNL